jgi:Spy/CpxP family protein refolding chaperone
MKRNTIITAIAAAAATIALLSGPVAAWNQGDQNGYRNHPSSMQGPGKHQRPGRHGQHDRGILAAVQQLDLSDEQRQQIAALMEEKREDRMDQRNERQADRSQLHALISAESLEPDAVAAYAEERAQATKERIIERVETGRKIYQLLTPEQRLELESMRQQRLAMRQQRGRD